MNVWDFNNVIRKYKKCPSCGSSNKDTKLQLDLTDGVITISCECGFLKKVDKDNNEIK